MKSSVVAALAALAVSAHASTNPITDQLRKGMLASSASVDITPPSQDPWYTAPPHYAAAAPGAILKVRAARGNFTGLTANSSEAYNILYRTTDSRYQPAWAVTTLIVPKNPGQNNKLLSYQIPYDSADVDASPSFALYAAPLSDITQALGRGWYVNVPDYEGPLASFTAGVQSGHATLDSVRAALNSGFGLVNGTRYAMWGYSGGALASEWAAELQVQYAQDLKFAGAAVGGLTPNVTSVLESVDGTFEAGLIPAGILGLASQYPDLMEFIQQELNPTGQYNATTFLAAKNQTLVESIGTFLNQNVTSYFRNGLATLLEPIPQRVINSDGIMGFHGVPQMPVFAYKAIEDEVSPVADSDALVERYCSVGATIKYDRNTVGSHTTESGNGEARAVTFLTSVLSGTYNATGCQISNVTINGTATS